MSDDLITRNNDLVALNTALLARINELNILVKDLQDENINLRRARTDLVEEIGELTAMFKRQAC